MVNRYYLKKHTHSSMEEIYKNIAYFFIGYFWTINSFYAFLIVLAAFLIIRRFQETEVEDPDLFLYSENVLSISVIIPVFNQEKIILSAIEGTIHLDYPAKEVLIVNDGSTDKTLETILNNYDFAPALIEKKEQMIPTAKIKKIYRSKKYPFLLVIDKEHSGRGDTVNAGINIASSRLFLAMDSDTVLDQKALLKMVRPFFSDPDTVAQGGTLRLLNGCKVENGRIKTVMLPIKFFPTIQATEYLRAFLYGRLGWNKLGGTLIISGAFGLFKRKEVLECGGYDITSIGEDLDLTIRLIRNQRKKGKKSGVMFVPDPIAWTFVPETYKSLARQRKRWHFGLIEVMRKNKDMFFNPKFGMTGIIGYPYLFFGELIEPLVEFAGLIFIFTGIYFRVFPWEVAIYFLIVTIGISLFLSLMSIVLEIVSFRVYRTPQQILRLMFYAIFENLGFRQLYILWRIQGFWKYFRKDKSW